MLDALDNKHKHRLLLVVTAAATKASLAATGQLQGIQIIPASGPVVIGETPAEVYRVRA